MRKLSVQSCQQNLFDLDGESVTSKHKGKRESNYVFDIVDALSAPVLTFSLSWADMIPERLLKVIPIARMASLMKSEELATYEECVAYIYTRTLESPMSSEWTDIYTHVGCKICENWFKEDHWDKVKAPRELNQWLKSKLNDLRRHIYSKRREILKQRIRDEKNGQEEFQNDNNSGQEGKYIDVVKPVQQSLF